MATGGTVVETIAGRGGEARLSRLNTDSLHERVYRELRDAIAGGKFASGEAVTIRGLADMLGTSAMPVREAVRRLVQDRSLEMLPNRTMRVPMMSLDVFRELTDVRATLEGHAARRAAELMNGETLRRIRTINERLDGAIRRRDAAKVVALNREFHFEIYRAAGSGVMMSVIDTLWQQSGPYLAALIEALSQSPEALPTVGFGRHLELLDALEAGDAAAASRAMDDDIRHAADWYVENVLRAGRD